MNHANLAVAAGNKTATVKNNVRRVGADANSAAKFQVTDLELKVPEPLVR